MIKSKVNLLFVCFLSFVIGSCTVQKRIHSSGYHISYSKSYTSSEKAKDQDKFDDNFSNNSIADKEEVKEEVEETSTKEVKKAKKILLVKDQETKKNKIEKHLIQNDKSTLAPLEKKESLSVESQVEDVDYERDLNTRLVMGDEADYYPTMHWGAVAGFVCAIIGIFFAGIIFGLLGVIFSAIALSKISNEPKRYSGQGLAIAGLIISVVVLVLTLITINAMMMA